MSRLARRVGERLLIGFHGLEPSTEVKQLLRDFAVGGVILFSRNVDSPEQVAELVRELQEVARDAGHETPLLVAVDQEGGRVARLREPWTRWPPLRVLGRAGGEAERLAEEMGKALAAELVPCGIHLDFAPVMDVDTNPDNPVIGDRSFGAEPEAVGRLGAAMIRGLQDSCVAACAKHFPGHGDTSVDSHFELPLVAHSRSRLDEVELVPFRAAVSAGVAAVMTAHVLVPELDEESPATLSPAVVGLLREELGFDGVVVADDLEMKAISGNVAEAAVRAARAGVDLFPVCSDHGLQTEVLEGLIHAFEAEALTPLSLDEAERRLRALKARFLPPASHPDPRVARQAAGSAAGLASEIAELGGGDA